MSTKEQTQTLIQAGILTPKGNLRKPYKVLGKSSSVGAVSRKKG